MKQLIEYIVSNIVNHPESVVITESEEDKGLLKYTIQTDPEDTGRVIGKQGKVIKAIRQIVRIAAIQKGVRVIVDLADDQGHAEDSSLEMPEAENEENVIEDVAEIVEEAKEEKEEEAEEKAQEEAKEEPEEDSK